MKKLIALSCVFLSLAALAPLTGCGGSGSSDDAPPGVAVVGDNDSRGIRVSWTEPSANASSQVLEYQIFRSGRLVGRVPANVTTFLDTTEDRIVTYNNLVIPDTFNGGEYAAQLIPTNTPATGLTKGTYTYSVAGIFRTRVDSLGNSRYENLFVFKQTEPITF